MQHVFEFLILPMHEMLWKFNTCVHGEIWNFAVSAIDVALWDIKGKFTTLPSGVFSARLKSRFHVNNWLTWKLF